MDDPLQLTPPPPKPPVTPPPAPPSSGTPPAPKPPVTPPVMPPKPPLVSNTPLPPTPPTPPKPPAPPVAPAPRVMYEIPKANAAPSGSGNGAAKPPANGAAPKAKPAAKEDANITFGSGGLRVSLMPSELEGKAPPDLGRGLMVLGLVIVMETIVLGALFFWLNSTVSARTTQGAELSAKVTELGQQISQQEKASAPAAAYNTQLAAAKEALDKHLVWTNFFAFLESKTRASIQYSSFSGNAESGTFTVDALGTSYRDVAEQLVVLREEPLVAEVRSSSASARVNDVGEVVGVAFTMVITMKPDLWLNGGAVAAGTASVAGIKECTGADAGSCFDAGLATCTLTALTVDGGAAAPSNRYEVLGNGAGGCLVRRTMTDKLNPALDGKSMTCPMNGAAGLAANLTALEAGKWATCTGPLVALLTPAAP